MQYFGYEQILVCTLPVARKMCDAKIMFSLFPSLKVRNQILAMGKNRHNYITMYVCRGVFGSGSGRKKKILDLMATNFYVLLTVQLSKFILVINQLDAQNLF